MRPTYRDQNGIMDKKNAYTGLHGSDTYIYRCISLGPTRVKQMGLGGGGDF